MKKEIDFDAPVTVTLRRYEWNRILIGLWAARWNLDEMSEECQRCFSELKKSRSFHQLYDKLDDLTEVLSEDPRNEAGRKKRKRQRFLRLVGLFVTSYCIGSIIASLFSAFGVGCLLFVLLLCFLCVFWGFQMEKGR